MDFLPEKRRRDFKEFCDIQTGNHAIPGIYVDYVGHQWPDFLSNGGVAPVPFFVSERVIQNLQEEEIPFRRAIEIPLGYIECPALQDVPPPRYYILEADIGIDTVNEEMRVPILQLPPGVEPALPEGGVIMMKQPNHRPVYDTWNGSPLFCPRSPVAEDQHYTRLYCDHRVWFLAMKEKWTNFKATPLSVV